MSPCISISEEIHMFKKHILRQSGMSESNNKLYFPLLTLFCL